ncbi:MAG: ABC transporter permease [Armatimonadota bacterium]|nr:ABC transporter permease [Armatimonadota bacterium]
MHLAPLQFSWQPNPILQREVRARWRRLPAVATVFAYAALLAGAMCWLYAERAADSLIQTPQYLATLGRQLFVALTMLQAGLWMLIAPTLTATTIAVERERGLLEALQLAPIGAYRIVAGKLLSILAFITLMLLVPLPIVAVCFLLGGVSPIEFVQALALHVITALHCAIIGLFFSARSRRPSQALRNAFVFITVWGGLSFWIYATSGSWAFVTGAVPDFELLWRQAAGVLALTNPCLAALAVLEPGSYQLYWPTPSYAPAGTAPVIMARVVGARPQFDPDLVWSTNLGLQAVFSLLLLWLTTRAVVKSLPEPFWMGQRRWVERLKARWEKQRQTDSPAREDIKQRAQQALLWEIPVASLIRCANPIMQRELRSKFRLRQAPVWMWLLRIIVGCPIVWIYLTALANALDNPRERLNSLQQFTMLALVCTLLGTMVMTAGTFTREREAGTWEALRLSLLAPHDIIIGKFAPPLLACFFFSMPLWPVWWYCIHPAEYQYVAFPRAHVVEHFVLGIPFGRAVAVVCILLASGWCSTALGMLMSWLSRSTAAAIGWTLAIFCVLLIGLPGLLLAGLGGSSWNDAANLFRPWHPALAIDILSRDPPRIYEYYAYYGYSASEDLDLLNQYNRGVVLATLCPLVLLIIGGALLGLIWSFMQQRFRDER